MAATADSGRLATLHDFVAEWLERNDAPLHARSYHLLRGTDPERGLGSAMESVPRLIDSGHWEESERLLLTVRSLEGLSRFASRWAALLLADLWQGRGRLMAARELLEVYARPSRAVDVAARTRLARIAHRQGLPAEAGLVPERRPGAPDHYGAGTR